MLDVSRTFRGMKHLGGRPGSLDDVLRQLFNGDLAAVTGIEHSGDFRVFRHKGKGSYNVFHIDEIARLGAVPIHGDVFSFDSFFNENGHGRSIGALGVLPGAEDIEEAHGCRIDFSFRPEHVEVVFPIQLGNGIGTLGLRVHGFQFGHRGIVSVNGGGRRQHDFFDSGGGSFLQHVQQTVDVDVDAFADLAHGFRHGDERGHVENIVHSLHRLAHQLPVADGTFDERVPEPFQVPEIARAQVVQHTDFLRLILIVFHNVGTDESGAAGYENLHVFPMLVDIG